MPTPLRPITAIGFIGLGVMGEPMCGHLARRSTLRSRRMTACANHWNASPPPA